MPLGVVSDDDFVAEQENCNKPIVVDKASKGRSEGDNNVPEFLRNIIGSTAIEDGRRQATSLADRFGISDSSVSAYSHGNTSTASYDTPNTPLREHLTASREKVTKRAQSKLLAAMAHISADKLKLTKARELAGIARDMSVVIKNMESPADAEGGNKPNINYVFYAPQIRAEESFEVIDVKE